MEEIMQTAGEAVTPPPAMPQTIEIRQTLGPFRSIRTTVIEDGVVTSAPPPLEPFDIIVEAHASLAPTNVDGRAIMMRVSEYMYEGTLARPGSSTARFDTDAAPSPACIEETLERFAPPTPGPKVGDLFTHDFVSFYEVRDPEDLTPSREKLLIHVPDGADWKTAVWGFVKECDKSIQVWNTNGLPTPVGPAD